MSMDAARLKAFYQTPLGQQVRRHLALLIRSHWPTISRQTVLGIGFASPFLGSFRREAKCVGCMMPARQGVLVWPANGHCNTLLVEESKWPLADNSVDRLVAVHSLEHARNSSALLREMWRILSPEGTLMIIVPNRIGLWCRTDATPFGYGLPFSRGQLETLLTEALFTPIDWKGALYFPPIDSRPTIKLTSPLEKLGHRLPQLMSGLIVVEARKDVAAPAAGSRKEIEGQTIGLKPIWQGISG